MRAHGDECALDAAARGMLPAPVMFQRTRGAVLLSQLDLNQAEIARRCGVARSAVGHWMTGRSRPGGDMRSTLARFYGIPFEAWIEPAAAGEGDGRRAGLPRAGGRFLA
ncbi:helix-turn-helix transcriptional regulator [Sorangium sp. So ce315]|uniref:helix-turn-helix domain-containing protein n=1 Tax=Sorangium sp. So ce315 TaxID=3133299 RepID=UPI003F623561